MVPSEMRMAYDGTRVKVRATVEEILSALQRKKLSLNKFRGAREKTGVAATGAKSIRSAKIAPRPAEAGGVRSWLHFGKEAEDNR